MTSWFREDVLRRVLRNTGVLGAGKAVGALLHLAALALTAHLLGPYAFGLIVLVRSYAQAASGLAKFQSWQTLIRFGAPAVERGEAAAFRDLAGLTLVVDGTTGLLALVAAVLIAPSIGLSFGIAPDAIGLAQLYCLAIPLMTSATPTGVLRIFDRFDRLAWQSVATPAFRLAGIALAALAGAPLWGYVAAWLVSDVLGELVLWIAAGRELDRRGLLGGAWPSPRRAIAANRGILRFAFASNLGATLTQAMAPLFTLLIGGLLGATAAGLYRVVQIVIDAVSAPAELAMRSLFPEAARLLERDKAHFWRILRRALALAALLGAAQAVLVVLFGPAVLAALGPGYDGVGTPLRVAAIGFVAIVGAYPLDTALLALGAAGRSAAVRGFAAAIAIGAAALLARPFGLTGVAAAATLAAGLSFAGLLLALARERNRPHVIADGSGLLRK